MTTTNRESATRRLIARSLVAAGALVALGAGIVGLSVLPAAAASTTSTTSSAAASLPIPKVGDTCSVSWQGDTLQQCWENTSSEVVQFSLKVTEKNRDRPEYQVRTADGEVVRWGRLDDASHLHLAPGERFGILKPYSTGTNTVEITGITPNQS